MRAADYVPGSPATYVRDVEPGGWDRHFTLARRMGTSVKMIDRAYGHLVAGAYERELLDAFDERQSPAVGRYLDALEGQHSA